MGTAWLFASRPVLPLPITNKNGVRLMAHCVVCKQPIKEGDVTIDTPQGTVHAGQCQQHLAEMAMSESGGDQQLVETQLLNG